jgi:hypothetical protein
VRRTGRHGALNLDRCKRGGCQMFDVRSQMSEF